MSTLNDGTALARRLLPARLWFIGMQLFIAAFLAILLSFQVLGGGNVPVQEVLAQPVFPAVLGINTLVALSFVLFIRQAGRTAIRVALTVIAALAVGFLITVFINPDPVATYTSLLTGPISRLNRWGNWIDDTLGLLLVSLAITIVFRARLFSLGAEGQIFLGGMASGVVALSVTGLAPELHLGLAIAAGCVAGLLWGLIPAFLRAYLGASELVSTLMLNPVAILLYEYLLTLIRPPGANAMASAPFPDSALLMRIVPRTRVTTGVFIAMAAVFLLWVLIERTPLGYEIRMIGANVRFAEYGGIRVRRTILLAMAISGILGGLTGSYLALGIHGRLPQSLSSNLTFEGVVAALLGRNNPLALPAMALLYAYLRVGGLYVQSDTGASLEIVRIIQGIIILLFTAEGLLGVFRRRQQVEQPTTA